MRKKAFLSAIRFLLHSGLVMCLSHFCDGFIQRCEAEKLFIPKPGINSAVDHLYLVFYQRFVLGFSSSGRNNGSAVMGGEICKCFTNFKLIAIGFCDC